MAEAFAKSDALPAKSFEYKEEKKKQQEKKQKKEDEHVELAQLHGAAVNAMRQSCK